MLKGFEEYKRGDFHGSRLRRIRRVFEFIKENNPIEDDDVILWAMVEFGVARRIAREYVIIARRLIGLDKRREKPRI